MSWRADVPGARRRLYARQGRGLADMPRRGLVLRVLNLVACVLLTLWFGTRLTSPLEALGELWVSACLLAPPAMLIGNLAKSRSRNELDRSTPGQLVLVQKGRVVGSLPEEAIVDARVLALPDHG